jgi:hypothetical protein
MAELIRRGVQPEALVPDQPNAPVIRFYVDEHEYRVRVKGYEGPSPRWRCLPGQGSRVFPEPMDERDFVAIVGMVKRDEGVLSWAYLRRTADMAQELVRRERQSPKDVGPFRELRINDPGDPSYYNQWQRFRNAWGDLGLANPPDAE